MMTAPVNDWAGADDAVKALQRICDDARYVAPENLAMQQRHRDEVCKQLDVITKALGIVVAVKR